MISRRKFVAASSAVGVSGLAAANLGWIAVPLALAPQLQLQGGISSAAQLNPQIRRLYFDFYHQLDAKRLPDLSATPRTGAYTQSFGYYFKYDIVQFGLVSSQVNQWAPGLEKFRAVSKAQGATFFDRKPSEKAAWLAANAKLQVYPLVFSETGGGSAYLRKKNLRLAAGVKVLSSAEEQAAILNIGLQPVGIDSVSNIAFGLVTGQIDMTTSMPWAQARKLTEALAAVDDLSKWEWVTDSVLFPEYHYELLFKIQTWKNLSHQSRNTIESVVENLRQQSKQTIKSEIGSEWAAQIVCRPETTNDLGAFAPSLHLV